VQHSTTRFLLPERHQTLDCAKCHAPNTHGPAIYRIHRFICVACHSDLHDLNLRESRIEIDAKAVISRSHSNNPHTKLLRMQQRGSGCWRDQVKTARAACCKPEAKPVRFRFKGQSCMVCHKDPQECKSTPWIKVALYDNMRGRKAWHATDAWNQLLGFAHIREARKLQSRGGQRVTAFQTTGPRQ